MDNKTSYDHAELRFIAFLLCLLTLFFVLSFYFGPKPQMAIEETTPQEEIKPSPFDEVEVRAAAAYVYDIRTGQVLYAKNENKRMPLASLTKVMASLVASEVAQPETEVSVTDEALRTEGESGLVAGEKWSLRTLLDFTLTSSSNDGMTAVALALGALSDSDATDEEKRADFVRLMNQKAEEIKMNNSYYWNVTGLDESNVKGGAYGTARDMAVLFEYILRTQPTLLEATREPEIVVRSLNNHVYTARNTGLAITGLPGVKASKTGYTSIAGGNLVIVFDPEVGRPIIISVLGSTVSERFTDVLKLAEASRNYLESGSDEGLADIRE